MAYRIRIARLDRSRFLLGLTRSLGLVYSDSNHHLNFLLAQHMDVQHRFLSNDP